MSIDTFNLHGETSSSSMSQFFFCSDKQWKILPSENEAEVIFDFVIFLHGKSLSNGAHADEYL